MTKSEVYAKLLQYHRLTLEERLRLIKTCEDANRLLEYWNYEYLTHERSEQVNRAFMEQLRRLQVEPPAERDRGTGAEWGDGGVGDVWDRGLRRE